ncbi:YceI-like domain protein [mine drainage metagenome]|uniref:YceI-like domain protein n=1 Tax=mine drainage metagenome TaxID=410659 RepID=A0A1J5TAS0_9ZZZZ
MDINAYKALKTDKFKNITFILTAAKVNADGTINGIGKLTIAGVTHDAELNVTYKINHDKSISISGSKKINLFYYNMQPSVFMGGLFKIGDEINVKFDLTLFKNK